MTTYYVGPGGNDGSAGTSWATRKLTLNGAEDIPVVAGDIVYVGPGVYREQLTCDVAGGAGTEIVYVGDVSGEHTDSIGGIVRVTGSDDDATYVRNYCVAVFAARSYRTFRGFQFDMPDLSCITINTSTNWIIEDCRFYSADLRGIDVLTTSQSDMTIRRCVFIGNNFADIRFFSPSDIDDRNHLVENCLFYGMQVGEGAVQSDNVGGITITNCTFVGNFISVYINATLSAGQTVIVNNCIFDNVRTALEAQALGEITEDYNSFHNNVTDRINVSVGGSSNTYPALFELPILHSGASQASGYKFPWWIGELSEWSQIRAITGTGTSSEDLWALTRPATASKLSWGACQYVDMERDTGTVYDGIASLKLADAGRHQVFVPTNAVSTTITCRVYREANYAGNAPQMIVKQPGQADDTTTDAGAASAWNELTTTLTPSGETDFIVVELVSRNTATAGNYATYFDNLVVS